jgi:hypothetical protein
MRARAWDSIGGCVICVTCVTEGPMTRTSPHKPPNAYRDRTWLAAVHRQWRQRANLPDLDQMFATAMTEPPMQNDVELELTIRGRDRTLCLPRVSVANVTPALDRLDWYRRTAAADQRVLEQAEASLNALTRASG